jgi:hypothetical protein
LFFQLLFFPLVVWAFSPSYLENKTDPPPEEEKGSKFINDLTQRYREKNINSYYVVIDNSTFIFIIIIE